MEKEKQILNKHIKEKGLRKTPERFAILEKVAEHKGHFTIDELWDYMREKNFPVSKSTLYYAMELFLECKLIERHSFGTNATYYERKFNKEPHSHQICVDCGKISEYRNRDVTRQIKHMGIRGFKTEAYQLNLYGTCAKCQRKRSSKK